MAGCCAEPGHCSNRRIQDFEQQQLELLKKQVKDFLFYDSYRNIRVLDPCYDLRTLDSTEAWENDPVHPISLVYSKIGGSSRQDQRPDESERGGHKATARQHGRRRTRRP
jgi:hypothetical protein